MTDYANYGLLVDYKYCSGCHSCEVACQEIKNLPKDIHGIVVLEKGPFKKNVSALEDAWDWDYIPVPTDRCDLCVDRLEKGKKPMCVKHCLAFCLEIGDVDDLAKRAAELGDKVLIVKPQ